MLEKIISYHQWADSVVIKALNQLSKEQFEDEMGGKLRSARFRTIHVVSALKTWISRLERKNIEYSRILKEVSALSKEDMLREWEQLDIHLGQVATHLDGDYLVTYKPSQGGNFSNSVEDILFHVINHATYHRAQLILILRTLEIDIPDTDYIFYVRRQ